MHYCPSSNWASITVSGNDGVVLTNKRERVLWWYNYFNPSLGAYFRFPQAVKYERTNPSNRYLHATIHITDLSKGNSITACVRRNNLLTRVRAYDTLSVIMESW